MPMEQSDSDLFGEEEAPPDGSEGAPQPRSRRKDPRTYKSTTEIRVCRACGGVVAPRTTPGRPREFCSRSCLRFGMILSELPTVTTKIVGNAETPEAKVRALRDLAAALSSEVGDLDDSRLEILRQTKERRGS